MNYYKLRLSFFGVYFNKARLKGINSPEELVQDFKNRKFKKKDAYYLYAIANPSMCLTIAKEVIEVRNGKIKTEKIEKSKETIINSDGSKTYYNHKGYKVTEYKDGSFEVWLCF